MVERPGDQRALPAANHAGENEREPEQIDIEQLAERVYRLMRDELRLLHARGSFYPAQRRR